MKSSAKNIAKKLSYFIAFVALLIILLFQTSPLVQKKKPITPEEMRIAKDSVKNVMDTLASYRTFVDFTFEVDDLEAISKLGSHVLPNTRVMITTSQFGVLLASSTKINLIGDYYINSQCLLVNDGENTNFESCKLGSIPIPNFLVSGLINSVMYLIMGEEVSTTFNALLASAQYNDEQVQLKAKKSKFFREEVNESISKVGDVATYYTKSSNVPPELVQIYVDDIMAVNSNSLSDYMKSLFSLASQRSKSNNAVDENTAIIWALAVTFGDYRFASLIGMPKQSKNKQVPLLRGRDDLTKHFIYSAALQQLGDVKIGLSIGEAKELLDSISGGSGLSFADLSADKAGLKFAQFITSSKSNAQQAQVLLKDISDESAFFPFIHDLPEGFKGSNFQRVITSTDSDNYKKVETEIDKRMEHLALFNTDRQPINNLNHESWATSLPNNYKMWFKADTHIHTKFSDGRFDVNEIAKQASIYGCDAIAITDHGDHNLKKVVSAEYFNAIEVAQDKYPYLTIIPGLEWNIPPMNGREHATLILPKTPNLQRNLTAFRARYDHYKRFDEKVLSPEEAFNWLEKNGQDDTNFKPMVIYNHPSRKDYHQEENEHDFTYWRNFTDLVIGFSGAPGHQKKRSENNGSYELRHKTINGWDPSIENIGGEWDRLLQQGYKVWAARAGSDFHNTKMDYWPCQFSSTHILANSADHNNVIEAYRSGAFWAQHGNFVKNVEFNVTTSNNQINLGQEGRGKNGELVSVNIDVKLNKKDWQGNYSMLDELELIVITEDKIDSIKFNELTVLNNNTKVEYQHEINSEFVIFRWRGKSIQPEQHSYMFYTNPIKVITTQY